MSLCMFLCIIYIFYMNGHMPALLLTHVTENDRSIGISWSTGWVVGTEGKIYVCKFVHVCMINVHGMLTYTPNFLQWFHIHTQQAVSVRQMSRNGPVGWGHACILTWNLMSFLAVVSLFTPSDDRVPGNNPLTSIPHGGRRGRESRAISLASSGRHWIICTLMSTH